MATLMMDGILYQEQNTLWHVTGTHVREYGELFRVAKSVEREGEGEGEGEGKGEGEGEGKRLINFNTATIPHTR